MSNSPLVSYTRISPNQSGTRKHAIDTITPHCVVGQITIKGLGDWFSKKSTACSSNYGIDKDGNVGMFVEEKDRSWCSSSRSNDNRAVTIECASDKTEPYRMNDCVYNKLVELCVDICKRNNKTVLLWFADKNKTVNYEPLPNEMVITVHRWFANKSCPGAWLYSRLDDLAREVTARLAGTAAPAPAPEPTPEPANKCPYLVRVKTENLRIRKGAGTNTKIIKYIEPGVYTIVEEKTGKGAKLWGKLKSGIGWIALDYTTKV